MKAHPTAPILAHRARVRERGRDRGREGERERERERERGGGRTGAEAFVQTKKKQRKTNNEGLFFFADTIINNGPRIGKEQFL